MAEHPNAPRCHHVRTNGLRCGSPSMRNQKLCYYHKRTSGTRGFPSRAHLPNLEDGNAIQLGIAQVLRELMTGAIEYRAAHLMMDGYRLALRNLKNMNIDPYQKKEITTVDPEFDAANAGAATEPASFQRQQELEAAGVFNVGAPSFPHPFAGRVENDGLETSTVGAPPLSLALGDRVGNESVASVTQFHPFDADDLPDPETLSEEEYEALVMRCSGNLAYFMPEEKHKPPASSESDIDFATDLRNALKDLTA